MEAFKAVETAKQGKETALNNAYKYRNEQVPEAQAQADGIIKNAEAQKEQRINEAVLYSGKVKVLLGKKDNFDEQVSALASILETAKKQGGSGEIDMRNYKVKDDIIFKKSEVY